MTTNPGSDQDGGGIAFTEKQKRLYPVLFREVTRHLLFSAPRPYCKRVAMSFRSSSSCECRLQSLRLFLPTRDSMFRLKLKP